MEGTPSRWRLSTEQQTPPVEPQTPQDDNVAPRRDQLPSTPLNMFHESSPSTQQQQAAAAGTDRSPWRTARVVTELPAIPTRPNQSYGTTGTVSLPRMNINDTNFSRFGNPSQSLLQLSTESHKRRQRGTARGDQYAAEQEALRRQYQSISAIQSRILRDREGQQAQPEVELEPEVIQNPARPTGQPNVRRNASRNTAHNPTQQTVPKSTQEAQRPRPPEFRPRSRERARRTRRSTADGLDDPALSTLTMWEKAKLLGEISWSVIKDYGPTFILTLVMLVVSCTIIWAGIIFFISPLAAYWNPVGSFRSWWKSGNQAGMPPGGGILFDPDGPFSDTTSHFTRPTDDSKIHEIIELARRVKDLELGLEKALKYKADKQDLKRWSDKFQALSQNFEEAKADTDRRLSDIEKLEIGKMLNQIGDRLDKAVKEIAEVKEFQQNTDAALKKLYADLPEMMPVRYGADGKVNVMPEFWSDVTKWFREQNFSQGSGNEGGTDTVIIEKPAKWEDFIAKNGRQLDAHVANLQDKWHKKALHEQTLIPKEYHLEMVKESRDEYLKHVEEKFHEVHNELGAQLSSLTNLKSMIESGSFGGAEGVRKPIGKSLADGLNSHHISKLADYASHAGGAFIDPERTSPTYEKHPQGAVVNFFHWAMNMPSRIPKPGKVISQDPRTPGDCWPFGGNVGTLGLILREPIYVSSMTIEHMEWERTLVQNAVPKTIALWVRVLEQEKYYEKLVREAAKSLGVSTAKVQAPKSFPIMYDYVRIGTFEFEFSETSAPEQTWTVPMDLRRLNISSDRVVVAVQDNYGNPNYTCLYRVKIHGEPVRKIGTTKLPVEEKKESPPASDKVEL